jgi:hypothetical protein
LARAAPIFTCSYGLRYEWQTNINDRGDFAPRIGFRMGPGSAKNGRQKTVSPWRLRHVLRSRQ